MAPKAEANTPALGLPVSVVGPVDLGRVIRELETIDTDLKQQAIRGDSDIKAPKTTKLLDQTLEVQKLELLSESDRATLLNFVKDLKQNAPVLHISFSADPSPLFTEKIVAWLRTNIDPLLLLTVGMQPNIGAGCVVRTTNKYFDFSLRDHFMQQRDLLMEGLRGVTKQAPAAASPASATTATVPTVPRAAA